MSRNKDLNRSRFSLFRRRPMVLILAIAILPLTAYLVISSVQSGNTVTPARPGPAAGVSAAPAAGAAETAQAGGPAPASPPVRVCGNARLLTGPSARPKGAIKIPAGKNTAFEASFRLRPNKTYWFAPGLHTFGKSPFDQIQPRDGDRFIGAPGAILSGQGRNNFAFASNARNVSISYLTIEGFTPPGSQGTVNQDLARGWRVSHNTIQRNAPGAGVMIAGGNVVQYNCLTANGEYGFSAVSAGKGLGTSTLTGGPVGIVLSHNEISYNNTCNFENVSPDPVPAAQIPSICRGVRQQADCGCSGGGKFWQVQNAMVVGNYVHGNYDVGLWADTNNDGFIFRRNYISDNYAEGIIYETSYNALIQDNTFAGNAVGAGPGNPGFPAPAIYISESGGDSRVPNAAGITTITISGNVFTGNWSGVVLWESADRFCGSPDNSSAGICTLADPGVATISTCNQSHLTGARKSGRPDYYDLCRWKTQNVLVRDNTFTAAAAAAPRCRGAKNSCNENGLFSQFGTDPSWSPYKGFVIENAITKSQHNKFSGNTYSGSWKYVYRDQGGILSPAQWRVKGQD